MESNKQNQGLNTGKNEKEPMDKITKTILVVLIVVFIVAVVAAKMFM